MGRSCSYVGSGVQQLLRNKPRDSRKRHSQYLGEFLSPFSCMWEQNDVQEGFGLKTTCWQRFSFDSMYCNRFAKYSPGRTILLVTLILVMEGVYFLEQPSGSSIEDYPRLKWLIRTLKRARIPVSWPFHVIVFSTCLASFFRDGL